MLSRVVRVPCDGASFHRLMYSSGEDTSARKLVINQNLWTLCQPIAWFFSNNKHVRLQCLHAAGGQFSLARPKGEKSVQQPIAKFKFQARESREAKTEKGMREPENSRAVL